MLGGKAMRAMPAAFVGTMLAGFVLALAGLPMPLVEAVTALLGLGLAIG